MVLDYCSPQFIFFGSFFFLIQISCHAKGCQRWRRKGLFAWKIAKKFIFLFSIAMVKIVQFTVGCLVAKPLNRSEAKVDLVMIQTLLLFKCKLLCYHAN